MVVNEAGRNVLFCQKLSHLSEELVSDKEMLQVKVEPVYFKYFSDILVYCVLLSSVPLSSTYFTYVC